MSMHCQATLRQSRRVTSINLAPRSHLLYKKASILRSSVTSFSTSSFQNNGRPPLFQLERALIPGITPSIYSTADKKDIKPLSWTVNDNDECWAIIGPASESGGAVKKAIVDVLLGRSVPRQALLDDNSTTTPPTHPTVQPFLQNSSVPASSAIQHVSFSTRLVGGKSANAGEFVDYSVRYGAIRDEDCVTLYESCLQLLGVQTGAVARQNLVPDPLAPEGDEADGQTSERLRYSSPERRTEARINALKAHDTVMCLAPLLHLSSGDPPLLRQPLISLSNGQTRRARILAALALGGEVVIFEEPYTGLDPPTRTKLSGLLKQLHAKRQPRILLVLREQDHIPDFVTHELRIDDDGAILHSGPKVADPAEFLHTHTRNARIDPFQSPPGGYDTLKRIAASRPARGSLSNTTSSQPLVRLQNCSIAYQSKKVLNSVSLELYQSDRLILAGDNGSGKTTLLALLLGNHPQSFSIPRDQLTLFSAPRSAPSNATPFLSQRIGHLSPELFNAFPRRSLENGGMTVADAIGSGFEGVFTRRARNNIQERRIHNLLVLFSDLIRTPDNMVVASHGTSLSSSSLNIEPSHKPSHEVIEQLAQTSFAALSSGSQALVLLLRAVVHSPSLLILDEPFQGMDRRQVARARAFLERSLPATKTHTNSNGIDPFAIGDTPEERRQDEINRRQCAIVVVSHYETEWPATFDRFLRLHNGNVVEQV